MSDEQPISGDSITICRTINDIRREIRERRISGKKIGFVPTMGALHRGHLSLLKVARQKSDVVVASIFVNPAQFGPDEDFDTYPRQLDDDIKKCDEAGVNLVFAPEKYEVYPDKNYFSIQIEQLDDHMCGASRPGFFEGVVLIVNKLFNIIEPDIAVFGQKDIQQVQIIKRIVAEFNHHIEIVSAPIQRANDGLALSSRNIYLDTEQRKQAPGLYRSLKYIEQQIQSGVDKPGLLINHQKSELEAKGFEIDYLDVFAKKTLQPVSTLKKNTKYILAGAAYLGKTRLIDNILIEK